MGLKFVGDGIGCFPFDASFGETSDLTIFGAMIVRPAMFIGLKLDWLVVGVVNGELEGTAVEEG